MELATAASKHADSSAVESVIDIINELIDAEEAIRMLEATAE